LTGGYKRGNTLRVIVAFFESIKYVGHLFPLAFLRVFVGYFYLNQALLKYNGDFLTHPRIAEIISAGLAQSAAPSWYQDFLMQVAIPHWKVFSGVIVVLELLLGLSYLLGYLVRPMAMVGVLLGWFYFSVYPGHEVLYKTLIAVHITLAWLAAGRCLGFDYYFYKRNRGIWW
jgi:thiosulfate dehydrogenase [quinone] large subunit